MKLVHPDSLADTLNVINQAFFTEQALTMRQCEQAARWIAARQGQPRAYAGMPAPTEHDFSAGMAVFTGERVRTGAATAHILGEEACRALILLRARLPEVRAALARATAGMEQRLARCEQSSGAPAGMYCCGICTCAYWRHLAAGGLSRNGERLAAGMKALKAHRLDTGRWRRFPFFYALLALTEIDPALSRQEMKFAAPACERHLGTRGASTPNVTRRRRVAATILAKA